MRINVFISSKGTCSRREADRLVLAGRVMVNGKQADIGMDVSEEDTILLDGFALSASFENVYLLFNKPKGIVTTTDETKSDNIISYIAYPKRIFPVGRLDKESSGLIILTSDGQIVNKILRSEFKHEKEYTVKVTKPVTDVFLQKISNGVKIYNPAKHIYETTIPCKTKKISKHVFSIILTQGLNLQIRRMAKALDNHVETLERIRIMNLSVEDLPVGAWRHMTKKELNDLMNTISLI